MERKFKSMHKRATSQLKPQLIDGEDFISIHRFKPLDYSSKISINIKMPKVRLDPKPPQKLRQLSHSPLRNFVKLMKPSISPTTLTSPPTIYPSNSIKKLEKPQDYVKLVFFPNPNNRTGKVQLKTVAQETLPRLTRPKVQKQSKGEESHSIHFELLGFFIKKHLDYGPVYKKIDTDNKGFIDRYDLKNYFYSVSPPCSVEELVETILKLSRYISDEPFISKKSFFGLCCGIEYDVPFTYRLFVGESVEKFTSRVFYLKKVFKEFTSESVINKSDLQAVCGNFDEGTKKALELVTSEQVDFSRFLVCLPFFMWLRAVTEY